MTAITVTKELDNEGLTITVEVNDGASIPKDIFIIENTGTTEVGNYYGICGINDLTRMQVFNGSPINVFANKYLRYNQAKIKVNSASEADEVIAAIVSNITKLQDAYNTLKISTEIIQIT